MKSYPQVSTGPGDNCPTEAASGPSGKVWHVLPYVGTRWPLGDPETESEHRGSEPQSQVFPTHHGDTLEGNRLMATNPEALLISAVLRTKDHKTLVTKGVHPQMFHVYADEAKWMFSFITRHGKAPSKAAFKAKWPGFRLFAVDDTEHYCEEVQKEHARDGVMTVLDQAIAAVEDGDPDKVIAIMQRGMLEVQSRSRGLSPEYDAFTDWQDTYDVVAARVDRVAATGFAGVPFGFPTLDTISGGAQPGWLTVVAARLGQGKTWTGVRMGFAAAATGHKVVYFSLEQSRHQIAMRLQSFASKKYGQYVFNSLDLSRGRGFDLREYKKFLATMKDSIGQGGFSIRDASRGQVTVGTVASAIESVQPDLVIIDYLTLMGMDGDDYKAVGRVSSGLQGLGQRYGVPITALSQVSRLGVGNEPPTADTLTAADSIGHDADLLVTMAQKSKHVMKLKIAKFRHGPTGDMWNCKFSPGTGQYDEITADEAARQQEKDNEVE